MIENFKNKTNKKKTVSLSVLRRFLFDYNFFFCLHFSWKYRTTIKKKRKKEKNLMKTKWVIRPGRRLSLKWNIKRESDAKGKIPP